MQNILFRKAPEARQNWIISRGAAAVMGISTISNLELIRKPMRKFLCSIRERNYGKNILNGARILQKLLA